jgi:hypothetical protein
LLERRALFDDGDASLALALLHRAFAASDGRKGVGGNAAVLAVAVLFALHARATGRVAVARHAVAEMLARVVDAGVCRAGEIVGAFLVGLTADAA